MSLVEVSNAMAERVGSQPGVSGARVWLVSAQVVGDAGLGRLVVWTVSCERLVFHAIWFVVG